MEGMVPEAFSRTALLLGARGVAALWDSHVMLLGLGGVGSYAAEALARAGVGHLTLVDADTVAESNLNRQLPALRSTLGQLKTDVVAARLRDISPDIRLTLYPSFYLPESPVPIPPDVDYVIDAIDTVSAKVHLAAVCRARGVPLIACMGMGNRLDPAQVLYGDLFETSGDPLCRVMRRELRRRGIDRLEVVYSREAPVARAGDGGDAGGSPDAGGFPAAPAAPRKRLPPGSVSFVPSVAGLFLAARVARTLAEGHAGGGAGNALAGGS